MRSAQLRGAGMLAWIAVVLVSGGTGLESRARAEAGPIIEDIEPTSGPPGTLVHITGRRFAKNAAVSIGGKPLATESRLPNRISVRVPEGATSGHIEVSGDNGAVRGQEFTVTPKPPAPVIDRFEPSSGPPGAKVVLHGKNFSPRLTANTVKLGAQPAVVLSATPETIELTVPQGSQSGPFSISVTQAGEAISKAEFKVTASTKIDAISPDRGVPHGELTIRGQGFSVQAASNRVFLGTLKLKVKKASPTELVVELPAEIASGTVLVDVEGAGRASSQTPLMVQLPPKVLSISPTRGAPGTVITVHGTHLGENPAAIEAKLGDAALKVKSLSEKTLELEVPADAKSGRISIRVHGVGPAWSDEAFNVIVPPRPKRGAPAPPATPKP